MSPFKFPPPPPPPPKASSAESENARGGRGGWQHDIRGSRGRGRGQASYKGGIGITQHRPVGRQEYGNRQGKGGAPREQASPGRGAFFRQNYAKVQPQQPQTQQTIPHHVEARPLQNAGHGYDGKSQGPVLDPSALVQAMSFMATPAGQQSMAAFTNHMANTSGNQPTSAESDAQHLTPDASAKRKRMERGMNWHAENTKAHAIRPSLQKAGKPPRAKATPAPAVPSFGFTLPPAPTSSAQHAPSANKNVGPPELKKRKVNLGLTHSTADVEDECSAEEEGEHVDEEAAYAASQERLKHGVTFEHQGESISLQTAADVAAWIKERRRQFPTQQRILEKRQEKKAKREAELAFLRRLSGRAQDKSSVQELESNGRVRQDMSRTMNDTAMESREGLHSRPRVHPAQGLPEASAIHCSQPYAKPQDAVLPSQKRLPPIVDLNLGYDTDSSASSILSSSSVLSSSAPDSSLADSSSDWESGASSSSIPESRSTKHAPPPLPLPQQHPNSTRTQLLGSKSETRATTSDAPTSTAAIAAGTSAPQQPPPGSCPQHFATGRCKYGRRCRLAHHRKKKAVQRDGDGGDDDDDDDRRGSTSKLGHGRSTTSKTGDSTGEKARRPTLYARLVEQELEGADRLALQAVRWMGENGLLLGR